ncbi:MAG TPA: MBL fold metallo-hydrolase [Paenibacillus sp.]|uniref:MBL fold metallo-hydrolase n=1 Tax=Paenibacillus sp. TaxID=58172 RepID=UPI002CD231C4|nr:MBL fold metallo-hydrolase [Paenibacillus sp.]HUC91646.1 MBL fold metallo-hydrolase [Paenibacillus sp.]
MIRLSDKLYLYRDTCQVYIVKNGAQAVLIDFGSGDVLDRLADIGIARVGAILMTHHHRDQGQGLGRAVEAGIPVWVPHSEQDLFAAVDAHWQAREIYNNYNVRQDRFSLLEPVPVAGTLKDYGTQVFAGIAFTVLPTPGHTIGSITLLAQLDGRRLAFTGDLIYGPGKVWSLAATQWSYNGGEGLAYTAVSLLELQERGLDCLLPSHGEPMEAPAEAIGSLIGRLRELMELRGQYRQLLPMQERPFEEITPRLLRNRTSMANHYVLRSESGKALFFDFGYDFMMGLPSGCDRASRRPWLYTLQTLKRQYGIDRVEGVVPTHYHDDHVAGINLLRDIEGAQVWAADSFADILRRPEQYDLPCLWYDPIPVDRELPAGVPVRWEEFEFTLHPLPGHTLYAVAVSLEADGKRILISGDQYHGDEGLLENYVYPNRFRIDDFVESAALYESLQPEIIVTGHWAPLHVKPGHFAELAARGGTLARLHRDLLPLEDADFGAEGFGVRLSPYQVNVAAGQAFAVEAEAVNPFAHDAAAELRLVLPPGWRAEPASASAPLPARGARRVRFVITPADAPARRSRIAIDLSVDGGRFGQQAEALVTVEHNAGPRPD